MLRQGKDEKTTEAQYEEIMEGVYDARIASDRLEIVPSEDRKGKDE